MTKKILIIFVIGILLLFILTTRTYALQSIVNGVAGFKNSANTNSPIDQNELADVSSTVFNTFQIIGVIIAAIVIVILGIQFMTGTIEEKAKIKESLIPIIIGLVVLLGAYGIWKIIVDVMQDI